MEQYLKEHLLTVEVMRNYGLKIDMKRKEIEIPVYSSDWEYLFSKFRVFGIEGMKYRYQKGATMALYNSHLITDETERVYIVEGEFDSIALNEKLKKEKFNTVAVSSTGGAGSWNEDWNYLLEGKKVIILLDGDTPGVIGSVRVWEKIAKSNQEVGIIYLTAGYKDICEALYVSGELFMKAVIEDSRLMNLLKNEGGKLKRLALLRDCNDLLDSMEVNAWQGQMKYINEIRGVLKKIFDASRMKKKTFVTGTDVADIKRIPITDFIRFDRNGVTNCIFHTEKNPSMHYNDFNSTIPNTVKCYSCGAFGDVISVVMQLQNIGFKEALDQLKKQTHDKI